MEIISGTMRRRSFPMRTRPGAMRSTTRTRGCGASRSRTRFIGCAIPLRRPAARRGACDRRARPHVSLAELSEAWAGLPPATHRHIHLVLENDANQAALLDPVCGSAGGKISRAMERRLPPRLSCPAHRRGAGYYRDYRDAPQDLRRSLAEGFAYQGERSLHRGGAPRGEATAALPATAFVNFLQNHDQIGNRAWAERLVRARARGGAGRSACGDLAQPRPAADVHGRRMAHPAAVSVFLRFQGRSRQCGARRPAEGIRRGLCPPRATRCPIRSRRKPSSLPRSTGVQSKARTCGASRSRAQASRRAKGVRRAAPSPARSRSRRGGV